MNILEVIWKSDEEPTDIEYALNKFQETNSTKYKMEAITDYFKIQISTRYKIEAITKYLKRQLPTRYKMEAITNYFKTNFYKK